MKITFAALAFLLPAVAQSQDQCGPVLQVLQTLAGEYGEHMYSRGFTDTGAMIALFGNAATGTWTALTVLPDGLACVSAFGNDFATYPVPTGEDG